jgi:copper chaperone CopZ
VKDKTLAAASVISAVLASWCCIGPLVAAGLGLGAFGAAALFESLRAYLLALTAGLLGLAFYWTYRKQPQEKCEGGACATDPWKSRKTLLWTVTGAAAVLAAFPYYSSFFRSQAPPSPSTALAATSGSIRAEFHVEGMTCAGCALGIQAALSRREGVKEIQVLYDEKTAHVVFDPAIITAEQLSKAFEELGYKVTPRVGA